MIKECEVLQTTHREFFESGVETYLRNGWELVGGVSISVIFLPDSGLLQTWYAQAFMKKREETYE